jgi:hypothetical protein
MATKTPIKTPPSIGKPTGGGGVGGGGNFCATHTKLINTNKIEANILLFCMFIVWQMYKKKVVFNKI